MKKTTRIRAAVGVLSAAALLAGCGGVKTGSPGGDGEDYPSGDVTMLVGASAGGSTDLISRAVAKGLSDELGGDFPVVNREGANGALAAEGVKKAKADGSTIAVMNASTFVITPLAVTDAEKTRIENFDILHGISRDDYVMVASAKSGYKSIDDLANADERISFGTTGVGSGSQLSSVLMFKEAGIEARSVPFDGGAPALTAVLGNQVDVATIQIGEAIENVRSGKVVPLTVFSDERISYMPDVPTAKEQGVEVSVSQYRFLATPKGTPQGVKDKLVEALKATFKTEKYQRFNKENSLTPLEISGSELKAELAADAKRYADLVKEHGINLAED